MKMKTLCVAINREEEIMKNWVRSRITTGCWRWKIPKIEEEQGIRCGTEHEDWREETVAKKSVRGTG
jgi:hypothetical protein